MKLPALDRLNPHKIQLPNQAVFWLALFALVAIPLKIHSYNFRPRDDANRHVAKAISGKDWPDILVMEEQFQALDHNEGWHWVLTRLHELGLNADQLLFFSSAGLCLLFLLTGLLLFRNRPLSWLAGVLLLYPMIAVPRLIEGRPLLVSVTVLLGLMHLWSQETEGDTRKRWILTLVLIGLAGWVHGAWYLFLLVPVSVLLTGRVQEAIQCGAAWLGGSLLAGILNGSPWLFLWGQVRQTWVSVDTAAVGRQLVNEFQPVVLFAPVVLMLGVVLFRKLAGFSWKSLVESPAFWLALSGWSLGLVNGRFWWDWGTVGLMYLVARSLADWEGVFPEEKLNLHTHLLSVGFLAASVFLVYSADIDSRWNNADFNDPLSLEDPAHQGWLPDPGGILYSDEMLIYYFTFFENPKADWRYILGHEPALMPLEDLRVYRNLTFYEVRSWHFFKPWVDKMTPADRLILMRDVQPAIPELEWKYIAYKTWSGRLPRSAPPVE